MTPKKAEKVIREVIEKHLQRHYHFGANMWEAGHRDEHAQRCHEKRTEIMEAFEVLIHRRKQLELFDGN